MSKNSFMILQTFGIIWRKFYQVFYNIARRGILWTFPPNFDFKFGIFWTASQNNVKIVEFFEFHFIAFLYFVSDPFPEKKFWDFVCLLS